MGNTDDIVVDFASLRTLAGDDDAFVMALLMKMCSALPLAFTSMQAHTDAQDWGALRAAAHKAKSTFAYLSLDDMRNRFKEIEHHASDATNLDSLPQAVEEAIAIGNKILVALNAELQRMSG